MSSVITSIEKQIAEWMKPLPHLPAGFGKWLVVNAWWLVLIGVIASAWMIISAFTLLSTINSAVVPGFYGLVAQYNPNAITGLWISIIGIAVVLVLEAMAISPLKAQKKRGWELLFMASLLMFAVNIVEAIVTSDGGSLIGSVIGTAIGLYLLFEFRLGYEASAKPAHAATKKSETTTEKPPVTHDDK